MFICVSSLDMRAMSNIKVSNKFSDNVANPKMFGNCSKKIRTCIFTEESKANQGL